MLADALTTVLPAVALRFTAAILLFGLIVLAGKAWLVSVVIEADFTSSPTIELQPAKASAAIVKQSREIFRKLPLGARGAFCKTGAILCNLVGGGMHDCNQEDTLGHLRCRGTRLTNAGLPRSVFLTTYVERSDGRHRCFGFYFAVVSPSIRY